MERFSVPKWSAHCQGLNRSVLEFAVSLWLHVEYVAGCAGNTRKNHFLQLSDQVSRHVELEASLVGMLELHRVVRGPSSYPTQQCIRIKCKVADIENATMWL